MDELKTTDNVESQLTPQQYFERIKDKKYRFLVKFRKRGKYEIKSTFIKNRTYSYIQ